MGSEILGPLPDSPALHTYRRKLGPVDDGRRRSRQRGTGAFPRSTRRSPRTSPRPRRRAPQPEAGMTDREGNSSNCEPLSREPLRVSDFDFALPEELIAQQPPAERGTSRMLVLNRALPPDEASFADRSFVDLPSLLNPGDLLILNDSRVIPARLY